MFNFTNKPRISLIEELNKEISLKENFLGHIKAKVDFSRISTQLKNQKNKIQRFYKTLEQEVCSKIPNAFWYRKKYQISLPYVPNFSEDKIPTKARLIQMSYRLMMVCKKEIDELLKKKLIQKSSLPWSCAALYIDNATELERGVPHMVINYKPLNKVLQWTRHPIPNKTDLLNKVYNSKVFSKFNLKSGFWQVQIIPEDRYKTTFTVPFGHYEWTVMAFGLKKCPF